MGNVCDEETVNAADRGLILRFSAARDEYSSQQLKGKILEISESNLWKELWYSSEKKKRQ